MQGFFRFLPAADEMAVERPTCPAQQHVGLHREAEEQQIVRQEVEWVTTSECSV